MGSLTKRLAKRKRSQQGSPSESVSKTVTEEAKEILRETLANPFGETISNLFREAKILHDMIQSGRKPLGLSYTEARQFVAVMCVGILQVRDRYVEEKLGYNPISKEATQGKRKIIPSSNFDLERPQ